MTTNTMTAKDRITKRLTASFQPTSLEVIDESELHHGHAGWREGGETHFRVKIVADAFTSKSRVDRHRMVNDALADELAAGLHALAIKASGPNEV